MNKAIEDLIKRAQTVNSRIRKAVPVNSGGEQTLAEGLAELGDKITRANNAEKQGLEYSAIRAERNIVQSAEEAKNAADRIGELVSVTKRLHANDEQKVRAALAQLQQKFPGRNFSYDNIDHARNFVKDELTQATQQAETLLEKGKTAWRGIGKKATEEVEEKSGFLKRNFSNMFERHEKWLATKSENARIGITAAESALGFVGVIMGLSTMYSVATSNVKHKAEAGPDGETLITLQPVTASDRLLKLAAGLGITVAGITSIAMAARGTGGHGV
ncbi:MAG: hypothetical protein AB7L92_04020 [Alphaproteobacteria bacterium]